MNILKVIKCPVIYTTAFKKQSASDKKKKNDVTYPFPELPLL